MGLFSSTRGIQSALTELLHQGSTRPREASADPGGALFSRTPDPRRRRLWATDPRVIGLGFQGCARASYSDDGTPDTVSRQIEDLMMRFLVVYAHPKEDSYQSAIHRSVVEALTQAGHQVDDCDLYAEGFQPILGNTELSRYPDGSQNRSIAPREVERLLRCEGLVFVFPTWWYGMPAILKGYFDRVWLPGVAFEISGSRTIPLLTSIVRLGVVTTFGSPWWVNNLYLGNPNRKILMRGVCRLLSPHARTLWLAQYGMDYIDEAKRKHFLRHVARGFASF
jgi:NAD(P)H dehydrogenase (quinone)